jgi:hypothetical protein
MELVVPHAVRTTALESICRIDAKFQPAIPPAGYPAEPGPSPSGLLILRRRRQSTPLGRIKNPPERVLHVFFVINDQHLLMAALD